MTHALLERLEAEGKLDRDLRYEILDGELVIRGAPAVQHGEVVSLLGRHFGSWALRHGGKALVGVAIEIGDEQLVPDLSFIGPDRVGELDADGFHVPPRAGRSPTAATTRVSPTSSSTPAAR